MSELPNDIDLTELLFVAALIYPAVHSLSGDSELIALVLLAVEHEGVALSF